MKPKPTDREPPPIRWCRRRWIGQVSAISLASGLVGCGTDRQEDTDHQQGRGHQQRRDRHELTIRPEGTIRVDDTDPTVSRSQFRVTGPSMIPTLVPDHRTFDCGQCGVMLRVPAEPSPAADRATFRCWHCGRHHPVPRGPVIPGAVIELQDLPTVSGRTKLRGEAALRGVSTPAGGIGDLVATDHSGRLTVKRLLASPGMLVDLDRETVSRETVGRENVGRENVGGRPPRLTVDGKFPDEIDGFPVPWLPVDFDVRREDSRWMPTAESTGWRRVEAGWIHDAVESSASESSGSGDAPDWLLYRHRNVYRNDRRSPVFDDVPENIADPRPLRPVDRVEVRLTATCQTAGRLEVVRWHRRGITTETFSVGPTETSIRSVAIAERHGRNSTSTDRRDYPPVGPSEPIAIRVGTAGRWRLGAIVVERPVEYRLLASHDRDRYPIRLRADECFLVGDNVPISVDSRDWGTVPVRSLWRCQRIDGP